LTLKSSVQFIIVSSRFTTIALIILLTQGQNLRGIFFSNKARLSRSLIYVKITQANIIPHVLFQTHPPLPAVVHLAANKNSVEIMLQVTISHEITLK